MRWAILPGETASETFFKGQFCDCPMGFQPPVMAAFLFFI